jgi:hypothetical protein
VILYHWRGTDGRFYRMATGEHAQHEFMAGQFCEVQTSPDGTHWIAMVDWNAGVRGPAKSRTPEVER